MTLQEAIQARHSVRAYKELPLANETVRVLVDKITELNQKGRLHMQLIQNEPKAFQGTLAKYGKFRNVKCQQLYCHGRKEGCESARGEQN